MNTPTTNPPNPQPTRRGPAPQPLADRIYKPPPPRKRQKRSYTKEQKIQVLQYLQHQKVYDDSILLTRHRPRIREGMGWEGLYRPVTNDEASLHFLIPGSTIARWWLHRDEIMEMPKGRKNRAAVKKGVKGTGTGTGTGATGGSGEGIGAERHGESAVPEVTGSRETGPGVMAGTSAARAPASTPAHVRTPQANQANLGTTKTTMPPEPTLTPVPTPAPMQYPPPNMQRMTMYRPPAPAQAAPRTSVMAPTYQVLRPSVMAPTYPVPPFPGRPVLAPRPVPPPPVPIPAQGSGSIPPWLIMMSRLPGT